MKKLLPFIGVIVLVVLVAYAGSYYCCVAPVRALQSVQEPELAWLQKQFSLNDTEFQKICRLHSEYLPQCRDTCAKISAKNSEIREALLKAGKVTPEVETLMADAAALRLQCQKNMLGHFLAVSHTMPPEQGRRYLEWIENSTLGGMQDMMPDSCPACKK